MTDNMKKFGELLSKDEGIKNELEATLSGLSKDDKKAFTDAVIEVAAKHGLTLTAEDFGGEMKELSEDEMQAVAGDRTCHDWGYIFICFLSDGNF